MCDDPGDLKAATDPDRLNEMDSSLNVGGFTLEDGEAHQQRLQTEN